ncbi:MAG: DNA polymerase IV [Vulcanimicrobiaceae bacterium]
MIVHFDIDAFYASVAQRDDPQLRGKPVAVAGSSRRAVVLTASYEARPFGVRSAIPLYRARESCPDLIVVPPDFTRYREASRAVFAIFERGAQAVEGLSLDEAYVLLADDRLDAAVAYARTVRAAVRAEVGLAVSAGVARQKLLAKIASDDAKPDGLRTVEPGTEAAYLAGLPVARLWGVGPKTAAVLVATGIERIEQLARLDDPTLARLLGRSGFELRELARGNDSRVVRGDRETHSVSSEETFEYDLRSIDELQPHLRELAADVARRLIADGLRGKTIGIKLKRTDFSVVVRQTTVAEPTSDAAAILAAAEHCLLRSGALGEPVRLLGVRVGTLTKEPIVQMSMLAE